MKCRDCKRLRTLESFKDKGWCLAPMGRYKSNGTMKVNPDIERDCKLFEHAKEV